MSQKAANEGITNFWRTIGPRFLPFADAATKELPLTQILRLSLFQISVGMAVVLLTGTLNRVMIVELGVPSSLVALMVALPLVFAPFRALLGFRSDTHRSKLGWRRVPFIWMGTMLQFGGLAIMPFALLALSADYVPNYIGYTGAALAFLLVGAGFHTTQTAGLALATDLAPEEVRPRVVALLYVMLLLGMVGSALIFGALLQDFSEERLIRVIQGVAVATMALNILALWKQEGRDPSRTRGSGPRPRFSEAWQTFSQQGRTLRFLVAVGLGTAAFTMQDILLEPYGGEILGLSVSATTMLTALFAGGTLVAFALAAKVLSSGFDPHRLAALGILVGVVAFSLVIFSAPMDSPMFFRIGAALIGFGGGLFIVSTLIIAMGLVHGGQSGLALGAWGAVHATAAGLGVALGGAINDAVSWLAARGLLSASLDSPVTGYAVVYHLEILLLFATLVVIGPLVRSAPTASLQPPSKFGIAEFPN
ncbi:BCD family MFS transporter [Thiorhodospira sibirica]|uniref:BCD family MFS transporter n=1 Tax=Thiorhodospira sibirica TaxID=154347 RepID=UPI00022C39D6|nr:BCD family MFS transporter [Thiorhodospira sibirica]